MTKLTKRVSVYVTPEKKKEIKTYASYLEMSISAFIELAIREKIERELKRSKK